MVALKQQVQSIRRMNGPWRKIFFQYPDALRELNRVMATKCAEIAPVLIHLLWLAAPQHNNPLRPLLGES
jgi:hypothetical protein